MTAERKCRNISRWVGVVVPLSFLFILLASGVPSIRAETIVFRILLDGDIIISPNSHLRAGVNMTTPDQKKDSRPEQVASIQLPLPGSETTDRIDCSKPRGIKFFASLPSLNYELDERDKGQPCREGEISFTFHKKHYIILRNAAVDEMYLKNNKITDSVATNLQNNFVKAFQQKDVGSALILSSEIENRIMQLDIADPAKVAEPYRVFNQDLATANLYNYNEGLYFDPQKQRYELKPATVAKIKDFQRSKNISANGKLDYSTMKAIGAYTAMDFKWD